MPARQLDDIRCVWFACTVGTAASCLVLDFERRLWNFSDDVAGLTLLVCSAIIGGAVAARYVSDKWRPFPCWVVALMMTLRFYDPIWNHTLSQPMTVQIPTAIGAFAGAYLGNRFIGLIRNAH